MNTCESRVTLGLVLLSCTFGCVVGLLTNGQAMTYLSQYGYLSPSIKDSEVGNIVSEKTVVKAIKDFQSFAGINQTGRLDDNTLRYMSLPRCGVQDVVEVTSDSKSRTRRYVSNGDKWNVNDLTYNISKYPKLLGMSETDSEIRRAFDVWSNVTPLKFTHKKSGKVDITIRFEDGENGDEYPFDSNHVVISYSFFPKYGGDVYFDGSAEWSVNSTEGINLFPRAVHELGHSLGLSHSMKKSSVMSAFYQGDSSTFTLSSDDVEAIQALYGSNNETEKTDTEKHHGILKNN